MVVLLASSDYDNSITSDDSMTRVSCHTHPRFLVIPCGLLQYSFRRGAEDHYRQAATSVE